MITFRMRREPKKPTRRHTQRLLFSHYPDHGRYPIRSILRRLRLAHVAPEECTVSVVVSTFYFYHEQPESDESFNKRMAKYEAKLKDYNDWLQKHSDHLQSIKHQKEVRKFEVQRRKKEKLKQKRDELEQKIRELEAQGI